MSAVFTKDDLAVLLNHEGGPCVSIFMPAHRAGPEIRQDPIRFKNLLSKAEEELEALGFRSPDARDFLADAAALLEDGEFWRHQDLGMAVYISRNFFRCFSAPLPFDEMVLVAERFHVKPLLPLLAADGRFYVLLFDLSRVRVFEGSRHSLRELPSERLPKSITEVTAITVLPDDIGFHGLRPNSGASSGMQTAMYHALGESPEDYRHVEVVEYVKRIAKAMDDYLSGSQVPLVLAAPAQLQGYYRSNSNYRFLVDDGIEKHPGALDKEDLHRRAYALVEPIFDKDRREARDRLLALMGDGEQRACNKLEEIVPAASFGRIDTLFVASDRRQWGRFDRVAGKVLTHESRQPQDEDLLDRAAAETLLNGGTVYAMPAEQVPGGEAAAAILRY